MFCIFSIDGADPILRDTALGQSTQDVDFFVCSACFIASDTYFTKRLAEGSIQVDSSWDETKRYDEMIVPYPVAPIELRETCVPSEDERNEMVGREVGSGIYHRLADHLLWTLDVELSAPSLCCPDCKASMHQVAIIDSDDEIPLENADGLGVSLLWSDYLAVFHCDSCKILGYTPVR